MSNIYSFLCQKLHQEKNQYSYFDALSILIGHRNARIFCVDHLNLKYRTIVEPVPDSNPIDVDYMIIDD